MESFVDLVFPLRGLDRSEGFGAQPPGTTPVGQNVRAYEPSTDRARGGNRPGLAKFLSQQLPSGSNLVQHLNIVVVAGGDALIGKFDPPELDEVTGLPRQEDPSSRGPASSWGTTVLAVDGTNPVTGETLQTRAPGGSDGSRRRTRKGGSARQPSKNVLTLAPNPSGLRWFGNGAVRFSGGTMNGILASFAVTQCFGVLFTPTTVENFQEWHTKLQAFLYRLEVLNQTYATYTLEIDHVYGGTQACP